jgi:hypothetical protein
MGKEIYLLSISRKAKTPFSSRNLSNDPHEKQWVEHIINSKLMGIIHRFESGYAVYCYEDQIHESFVKLKEFTIKDMEEMLAKKQKHLETIKNISL